jgi:hypothetical protein
MTNLTTHTNPLDLSQYFLGNNTEIWIGETVLTRTAPALTRRTLIIDAAAPTPVPAGNIAGAVAVPTTGRLYDRQRIVLPNNQVIMIDASGQPLDASTGTSYYPPGITSFALVPCIGPMVYPAGLLPYENFVPFFSASEFTFKNSAGKVTFQNFGAGNQKISAKTSLEGTSSTNGYVTRIDPALQTIRQVANSTTDRIKMRIIPPDGHGFEFVADVASDDRSSKVDEAYMAPIEFTIGSTVNLINFNLS